MCPLKWHPVSLSDVESIFSRCPIHNDCSRIQVWLVLLKHTTFSCGCQLHFEFIYQIMYVVIAASGQALSVSPLWKHPAHQVREACIRFDNPILLQCVYVVNYILHLFIMLHFLTMEGSCLTDWNTAHTLLLPSTCYPQGMPL